MPKRVRLPDGSVGVFPDDMEDSAIEAILAREFPKPVDPRTPGQVFAGTLHTDEQGRTLSFPHMAVPSKKEVPGQIRNLTTVLSLPLALPTATALMAAGAGTAALAEGKDVKGAAKEAATTGALTYGGGRVLQAAFEKLIGPAAARIFGTGLKSEPVPPVGGGEVSTFVPTPKKDVARMLLEEGTGPGEVSVRNTAQKVFEKAEEQAAKAASVNKEALRALAEAKNLTDVEKEAIFGAFRARSKEVLREAGDAARRATLAKAAESASVGIPELGVGGVGTVGAYKLLGTPGGLATLLGVFPASRRFIGWGLHRIAKFAVANPSIVPALAKLTRDQAKALDEELSTETPESPGKE